MVGKTHFCGSDITLVFTDEKFCGYVSIAEKASRVDLDDIGMECAPILPAENVLRWSSMGIVISRGKIA